MDHTRISFPRKVGKVREGIMLCVGSVEGIILGGGGSATACSTALPE
jgi:hypothetical protein